MYSQSPSGVAADPSTPIILKIEGNDCEFVPNVIGLDLASARAQLDPSGFHYTWLYDCYQLAEHRQRSSRRTRQAARTSRPTR